MASITSANAVITLSITGLFPTPIQLQGFSADNIYDAPDTEVVQTSMGVDGTLSGGFVYNPIEQAYVLQADSDSNRVFEQWADAMNTLRDVYTANGTTNLVATGRSYTMTKGFLVSLPKFPTAARTLQPRRYAIRWESVISSPN